jgi:hypothetical protein
VTGFPIRSSQFGTPILRRATASWSASPEAAYEQGRQAHLTGGYEAGFTLGNDTGLSARQDTRAYVHGILDGFDAGCEQRHQLAGELLRRDQARRPASRRQAGREAEAS